MGEHRTAAKPLIAVATPFGSTGSFEYIRSTVRTFAGPPELSEWAVARLDCVGSLTAHNRNVLCADALDLGCMVLVEVDSDMVWAPEDVRALVAPIMAGKADIVSAPCSPRVIDWEYLAAAVARGETNLQRHIGPSHMEHLPGSDRVLRGFKHGGHTYVRMARMGLGMCAISRDALLRLSAAAPSYPYHGRTLADLHPQGASPERYQSEDLGFFAVVEQAGIPVHVCATADVGHESAGNVFRQDWFNGLMKQGWTFEEES